MSTAADNVEIAKASYLTYVRKDRAALEALLADAKASAFATRK